MVDILTKREFLYRAYFNSKGLTASLPAYLFASPENNFLIELQKSYRLVDPALFSSEFSRELNYLNLNYTRFTFLNDLISHTGVNTSWAHNFIKYYLLGDKNLTSFSLRSNTELYKNQYRPLKKGVTNMIRLHTTGAIAVPIETRLHILASSRDVIHS